MLHRTNWGALVSGLVLLAIAGIFVLDVVTNRPAPLLAVIPLLLVGLGTAAVLNRRFERSRRARSTRDPD